MEKVRNWLTSYRRHYVANLHWVYVALLFIVYSVLLYNIAYGQGWDDSFELFNKLRPHRPLIG